MLHTVLMTFGITESPTPAAPPAPARTGAALIAQEDSHVSDLLTTDALRELGLLNSFSFAATSTRGADVRAIVAAVEQHGEVFVYDKYTPDSITEAVADAPNVVIPAETYSKGDSKGQPRHAADVLAAIKRSDNGDSLTFDAPQGDADNGLYGFRVTTK